MPSLKNEAWLSCPLRHPPDPLPVQRKCTDNDLRKVLLASPLLQSALRNREVGMRKALVEMSKSSVVAEGMVGCRRGTQTPEVHKYFHTSVSDDSPGLRNQPLADPSMAPQVRFLEGFYASHPVISEDYTNLADSLLSMWQTSIDDPGKGGHRGD